MTEQWKPIETQPLDGRMIIVCTRNGSVTMCPSKPPAIAAPWADDIPPPDDGWNAAYWMPLPEPPADLDTFEPEWARGKATTAQ